MKVRLAEPRDAEAIGRVRVQAWQAAYTPYMSAAYLSSLDPSERLNELRKILVAPDPPFLMKVAEMDDAVVGFSMLGEPRYQTDAGVLELWALNIDPGHWRKGIGAALVKEALADAKRRGARRVELWCIDGNTAAISLYRQRGFVVTSNHRTTSAISGAPLREIACMYELQ